jgi:methylamine dehydrogenase accessory protein MauD
MDWLVLSNIALWIGFVTLLVVNLALARQIGVLYERVAPAGALMMNQTLSVGSPSPQLELETIDGATVAVGAGTGGRSQLLFFLSPDCPVCNELTPALKAAARAEAGWLDVILASDGDQQDHAGYVERKGLDGFPYVVSELLGRSFGVAKLPYAVLIDEGRNIASMGIINSREHLDSLFEAKERKVASIQDYMNKKQGVQYVEADKA